LAHEIKPENCRRYCRYRRLLHYRSPRHVCTKASAWKTKVAAPFAVRSVAAAASLLSPSSVIDAALRAHHKRKLFENPYVAGQFYFEAQSVSNKLTHETGEKKGSKLLRSLYADFYGGSMAQL
jgi:hypothetical protein